jgi:serine/threonine protein kinase/tetratricopeptide (TPR) repeat protein
MTEASIFAAVLEKATEEERASYLAEACAGDAKLRRRVEALLRAHAEPDDILDPPPAQVATVDEAPIAERPGSRVGPYKLMEQIGEGGFGLVFVAEQTEPVKRKVALKVIKPGMDSRQVIARFEAERQALALMDHPNIAKVLEAGTTDSGRPYFVMELVRGIPITEYCDQNQLTPRERLELFVSVCQAIQHAHQKGIIHRDIKPSNVLVAPYDGRPVVKVIDFGVAKATGQRLTEKTLFTEFGAVIGTLEYMSPEQAELNNQDIDTRSDIYSLGVLLYELLTGTTPLTRQQLTLAAFSETLRIIREDEPPKPSTRLSESKDSLPSISARRQTEPVKLTRLMRGELDWIVMKALEKDRNRRYQTANGLATDVQRYLADDPVLACPPSVGYRLRKIVRRQKGTVVAASVVAVALVAGIVGTTAGLMQAQRRAEGERHAKDEAQKRLAQVEKGTELLAAIFGHLDPIAAEKEGMPPRVLLARWLGQAAQQLEGETVGDPLVVARLQHVLGCSLRELDDLPRAEAVLLKACQTREQLLGADHLDTVAARHDLALLHRAKGNYAEAEALHEEVLAVRTAQLGADHPDTLSTQHHLAIVHHDLKQAEALFQEVLAIRTAKLGADHPDTLHTKHRLAILYWQQHKNALAQQLCQEVLALRTAKLGLSHLDTVASKRLLAGLYHAQRKDAVAEAMYQEVLAVQTAKLGADHLDTVVTKGHLASLYLKRGNFAPAEKLFKEVLAVQTAKLGADHFRTLSIQRYLAWLYHRQGMWAPAEKLYQGVLAIRTEKLGADHADTLSVKCDLADLYAWQGKGAPAEALYKEVIAIYTVKLGADDPNTVNIQHELAKVYYRLMQKHEDAIALLGDVLKRRKDKLGPDQPDTLDAQLDLGDSYCHAGRFADAEPLLVQAYDAIRERAAKALLEEPGCLITTLERLVYLYRAWGKPDEAAKWWKELEKTKAQAAK